MSYKISEKGVAFIKRHEGFKSKAYLDTVGVWTIGYGTTKRVYKGKTCTEAEASKWLMEDVQPALAYLWKMNDRLDQQTVDALVDWAYNCGLRTNSTLMKLVRHYAPKEALCDELVKWNKGTVNGRKVVLDGLTQRRKDEVELIKTGRYE